MRIHPSLYLPSLPIVLAAASFYAGRTLPPEGRQHDFTFMLICLVGALLPLALYKRYGISMFRSFNGLIGGLLFGSVLAFWFIIGLPQLHQGVPTEIQVAIVFLAALGLLFTVFELAAECRIRFKKQGT